MSKDYNPKEIENKWQKEWLESGIYNAEDSSSKEKYYALIEFPYPSGDGLHVGHPRPYIGIDIIARKRRMEGKNVLYPIGWDAFGLPIENYALKTGKDPRVVTKENTDTFRRQIQSLGISFDWSREINTTDPKYYKWTQWLFLKFLEKGLAYKAKMPINWCPKDKIGLANEEVVDGKCERCGTEVEQREKEQWMLAITKYADRLDKDLETVDYPERVKTQQRNWIGKREGALIKFDDLEVFTTRPDTLFGVTYIAVAGKQDKFTGKSVTHPATGEKIPVWEAEYVMADVGTGAVMGVPAHDERDWDFAVRNKLPIKHVLMPSLFDHTNPPQDGKENTFRNMVLVILYNPKTDKYLTLKWKKQPWVAFITGGTEAGEDREQAAIREIAEETGYTNVRLVRSLGMTEAFFFAAHKNVNRQTHGEHFLFELVDDTQVEISDDEKERHELQWLSAEEILKTKIQHVEFNMLWERIQTGKSVYTGEGVIGDSGEFTGLKSEEVRKKITEKYGTPKTTYKLRDWVFSRQRYWGEPIPVIHCEKCGIVPVPDKDLPVELPVVEKYEPGPDGESPLANIDNWVNVKCPKCDGVAKRETDVMPNWAGSSWYFYRYADDKNDKEFASQEKLKYWMPVDWYNGGMEHTVLHLLYSRFWNKFLYDLKLVPTSEPYKKRTSHGLILAEGGEKMSKSKGNVVNPDKIVEQFGADTLRVYEMFMGPFEQAIAWSDEALVGQRRFLERVWRLKTKISKGRTLDTDSQGSTLVHQTVKKVTEDIENLRFNTAISSLMILVNVLEKEEKISKEVFETVLALLAPFAPHITEELWHELEHTDSIHLSAWPKYDEAKLEKNEYNIAVQVNGKVRATVTVSSNHSDGDVKALALALPEVKKWLGENVPKKVIVVPKRLVSIVI